MHFHSLQVWCWQLNCFAPPSTGQSALEQLAEIFEIFGFIAVRQDMRGTHKSQGNLLCCVNSHSRFRVEVIHSFAGNFSLWQTEGDDGYDTIKWIVQQPWSNGIVRYATLLQVISSIQ